MNAFIRLTSMMLITGEIVYAADDSLSPNPFSEKLLSSSTLLSPIAIRPPIDTEQETDQNNHHRHVKKEDENPLTYMVEAREAQKNGQPDEAIKLYQRAAKLFERKSMITDNILYLHHAADASRYAGYELLKKAARQDVETNKNETAGLGGRLFLGKSSHPSLFDLAAEDYRRAGDEPMAKLMDEQAKSMRTKTSTSKQSK
ncbi:MAG: hypothetical protein NTX76_01415 [Alphaproteobacteria bacterium]|nr:hypothetical protein [Alphaproteobacteria bacterium]